MGATRLLPKQTLSGWRITLAWEYTHTRIYLATVSPRQYSTCYKIDARSNLQFIRALVAGSLIHPIKCREAMALIELLTSMRYAETMIMPYGTGITHMSDPCTMS